MLFSDFALKRYTQITLVKSYQVGLLQERAYQILHEETKRILKPFNLIPAEWALLGLIHDNTGNLTTSQAAQDMGVRVPYITKLSKRLLKAGYSTTQKKPGNKKTYYFVITPHGKALMHKIEPLLRKKMRARIAGMSLRDLLGYVRVIRAIQKSGL